MPRAFKLTKAQKYFLAQRYAAGEKGPALAAEFGVNPSYPGVVAHKLGMPKKVMLASCPHCQKPLTQPRA